MLCTAKEKLIHTRELDGETGLANEVITVKLKREDVESAVSVFG